MADSKMDYAAPDEVVALEELEFYLYSKSD